MISEEELKAIMKGDIMACHRLRIKGFLSDAECRKAHRRILKAIESEGYLVKEVGFYEYEFTKVKNESD